MILFINHFLCVILSSMGDFMKKNKEQNENALWIKTAIKEAMEKKPIYQDIKDLEELKEFKSFFDNVVKVKDKLDQTSLKKFDDIIDKNLIKQKKKFKSLFNVYSCSFPTEFKNYPGFLEYKNEILKNMNEILEEAIENFSNNKKFVSRSEEYEEYNNKIINSINKKLDGNSYVLLSYDDLKEIIKYVTSDYNLQITIIDKIFEHNCQVHERFIYLNEEKKEEEELYQEPVPVKKEKTRNKKTLSKEAGNLYLQIERIVKYKNNENNYIKDIISICDEYDNSILEEIVAYCSDIIEDVKISEKEIQKKVNAILLPILESKEESFDIENKPIVLFKGFQNDKSTIEKDIEKLPMANGKENYKLIAMSLITNIKNNNLSNRSNYDAFNEKIIRVKLNSGVRVILEDWGNKIYNIILVSLKKTNSNIEYENAIRSRIDTKYKQMMLEKLQDPISKEQIIEMNEQVYEKLIDNYGIKLDKDGFVR